MYGRVTRVFQDKGYGFILGEDRKSYFAHYSNLNGECIAKGYYVYFKPFQNESSDYNAKDIIVIDSPEKQAKTENSSKRYKHRHKHHKPCNADKVIVYDRKFKRFVRAFFEEQEKRKKLRQRNVVVGA